MNKDNLKLNIAGALILGIVIGLFTFAMMLVFTTIYFRSVKNNEPMCTRYKVNVAPDGTWINRQVPCSQLEKEKDFIYEN